MHVRIFTMHLKVNPFLVAIVFICMTLGFSYLSFYTYPKYITGQIIKSLTPGTDLRNSLVKGSDLRSFLELGKVNTLNIRKLNNSICNEIHLQILDDDKLISGFYNIRKVCRKLCIDVKPTLFLRSNLCVLFDQKQKIEFVEKPIYYINYL